MMFRKNKVDSKIVEQINSLNRSLDALVIENLSLKSEIIDLKKTIELMKVIRDGESKL